MSEPEPIIVCCDSCKSPMNVSELAPFSKVECPSCGAHSRVKKEFGPYTLRRKLAIGGMSVVFAAHDSTLDREVALKILNEDYSSDERRIAAFEEEARLTALLSHPHVVRVLTTGRAFGRFYIAMEMVAGGHFEHHIRERGKIPETEMLPLAIQITQGLKAAHGAGLIHRDIKPGNILLDAEGNAKIVDFGLALVTQGGKAKASELWATPYYVPPETIEGQPEDFRSDIYAFGATLYHALAGKPSCDQETMATDLLREAKKKVIPLHQAAPGLSADVCLIVDKAMAYDPNDRFSSYEEMIARMEATMKRLKLGQTGEIETAGAASIRREKRKRSERAAMISAGLVLIAAMAGAILWVTRSEFAEEAPPPPLAVVASVETPDLATTPIDVASRYAEARTAIRERDFGRAVRRFERLRDNPEVQEPSRTWAGIEAIIAAYLNGDSTEARRLARLALEHARMAETKDGRIQSVIVPLLLRLDELPPVRVENPDTFPQDTAEGIAWMLSGLKNWEQGNLDEANLFFTALNESEENPDTSWLAIYQEKARDYLEDYEKLTAPVFHHFPENKSACEQAIAELQKIDAGLKTQGRAKFNVRVWQEDIARHAKLLEQKQASAAMEKPAPKKIELPEVMEELARQASACRFSEAADSLKKLPEDFPSAIQGSLLTLAESAAAFLGDLEEDLQVRSAPGPVRLKNGEFLVNVTASGEGGIRDAAGRSVKWEEISPDSIIELHRTLIRNSASETALQLRHERAISFDWLAGDRGRAKAAAAKLSVESPAFKRRWDAIADGLSDL